MKSLAEALQQEPEDSGPSNKIQESHSAPRCAIAGLLTPGFWLLLQPWHDWRYRNDFNASEENGCSPVYEPIVDYWIDSEPGPGYSSTQRSD